MAPIFQVGVFKFVAGVAEFWLELFEIEAFLAL
jgi:hypothetical protein